MAEYEKKFVIYCPDMAVILSDAVREITIFGTALKDITVFRLPLK